MQMIKLSKFLLLGSFLLPLSGLAVQSLHLGQATAVDRYGYTTGNPTVGSTHVFRNIGGTGNTQFDALFQITGIKPGINIVAGPEPRSATDTAFLDINGLTSEKNPWITFRMKIIEAGTYDVNTGNYTAANLTDSIRLQALDIDSNSGQTFSDFFGYRSDQTPTDVLLDYTTALGQSTFSNGSNNYEIFKLNLTGSALHNFTNVDLTATSDKQLQRPVSVNFEYDPGTFDKEFIWGFSGTNTTTLITRGMAINMTEPALVELVKSPVPEPATVALFAGVFVLGAACMRRRKV